MMQTRLRNIKKIIYLFVLLGLIVVVLNYLIPVGV